MFKHYTMNQVILPLDFEIKLYKNDIAFAVNHLIEIILCAYTQSVFSGRKIEALLKDSIRMMWLDQGYEPSYRMINRFHTNPLIAELLRQCFVQFRSRLVQDKEIDAEAILLTVQK